MIKYLIGPNKNRVLAHAKRLNTTNAIITLDNIITMPDNSFAIKVELEEGTIVHNIKAVDELPQ